VPRFGLGHCEIFLYDLAAGRSRQIPTQPDVEWLRVLHRHAHQGCARRRLRGAHLDQLEQPAIESIDNRLSFIGNWLS
jgi:hypothetical protein